MDCPHIPELGYGEFSKRLHEKVAGQRLPISGTLEVTYCCNVRCIHCYVGDARFNVSPRPELSYGEICRILDEIADEGCLWLLLTGGEPFTRSDFLDIYTYAKRKGLLLTVFTNGTLLTPAIVDYLREWPPFATEITLYGYTQETYERITGIPGSYARCMRGVELLLDRGIPLRLKTVAMKENIHELNALKSFAEGLGVQFYFDPMVHGTLDHHHGPVEQRLTAAEIVALDMADSKRREAWKRLYETTLSTHIDSQARYACGAGMNAFVIDPYGYLGLCMISRGPGYDLRQGSFAEGWRVAIPAERERPASLDQVCAECGLRLFCGQCPGWSLCENGTEDQHTDFLCQLAHLRIASLELSQR